MSHDLVIPPQNLEGARDAASAHAWFQHVTRHMPDGDPLLLRIQNGEISSDERKESPKVDAACKAWLHYLSFTEGAVIPG